MHTPGANASFFPVLHNSAPIPGLRISGSNVRGKRSLTN
jgi:hypothetical protein